MSSSWRNISACSTDDHSTLAPPGTVHLGLLLDSHAVLARHAAGAFNIIVRGVSSLVREARTGLAAEVPSEALPGGFLVSIERPTRADVVNIGGGSSSNRNSDAGQPGANIASGRRRGIWRHSWVQLLNLRPSVVLLLHGLANRFPAEVMTISFTVARIAVDTACASEYYSLLLEGDVWACAVADAPTFQASEAELCTASTFNMHAARDFIDSRTTLGASSKVPLLELSIYF